MCHFHVPFQCALPDECKWLKHQSISLVMNEIQRPYMQVPILGKPREKPYKTVRQRDRTSKVQLADADPAAGPSVRESCDLSANEPARDEVFMV